MAFVIAFLIGYFIFLYIIEVFTQKEGLAVKVFLWTIALGFLAFFLFVSCTALGVFAK
ncbi:MAG: hypothetical protein WC806_01315 [Candidatus Gracilibacteria bacterium]|jgi:hypothetical protein|nr:hypothetical protein [Candidatus Gracilibacteria bacterium]